jgi:uncharacterized protein YndB with AHSA1/START domain
VALIDQRILIDAPPQTIWEFVSDPDKLTRWHSGYSGVSVLTTQRTGAGTRRRCTPVGGGKDVIEEITTWVEGLGYEYQLADGGPYRTFQGRMRLQAVPDGTSVQWTISYRPKGLFGLLRDQIKGRRRLAQMMADSLRQLRRQVDLLGVRMDAEQRAKAGIQGRLDANARAQYQRRYAPPPGLETPVEDESGVPTSSPSMPDSPAMPSFVNELTDEIGEPDYSFKADTKPRPPEGLREAAAAQSKSETGDSPPPPPERITPPEGITPVEARPESDYRRTTPRGIPAVQPTLAGDSADEVPTKPKPPRDVGESMPAPSEIAPATPQRATLPPQTPDHDTGEISIWEAFGVKRPSEQDNETLEDLFRSVRKRQMARRPTAPRSLKQSGRVRRVDTATGLRVWLALRAARIRSNGGPDEE